MNRKMIARQLLKVAKSLVASDPFEKENLIDELVQRLGLDEYSEEMFRHDVENLRGDEWLSTVEELGDAELTDRFKKIIEE